MRTRRAFSLHPMARAREKPLVRSVSGLSTWMGSLVVRGSCRLLTRTGTRPRSRTTRTTISARPFEKSDRGRRGRSECGRPSCLPGRLSSRPQGPAPSPHPPWTGCAVARPVWSTDTPTKPGRSVGPLWRTGAHTPRPVTSISSGAEGTTEMHMPDRGNRKTKPLANDTPDRSPAGTRNGRSHRGAILARVPVSPSAAVLYPEALRTLACDHEKG